LFDYEQIEGENLRVEHQAANCLEFEGLFWQILATSRKWKMEISRNEEIIDLSFEQIRIQKKHNYLYRFIPFIQ